MEQTEDIFAMLDLMDRPAFCVRDGRIIRVNPAAARCLISEDTPIADLLATGQQEYSEFQSGCLYLTLNIGTLRRGASVSHMGSFDVFALEQDDGSAELQAMALASRELRQPLTSVMTIADRLFPIAGTDSDPALQEQVARINRGLFQMHRIICNMSDAYRYTQDTAPQQELRDVDALLREAFEASASLVSHAGITLRFTGLNEPVYSLTDVEKLERAVGNIISNAVKFSREGNCIDARLTRRGNMLYLTVQDSGAGVAEHMRSSVFTRYQRNPGIEDSRYGIGLGMVLIRSAAAVHGGTVLMDQREGGGGRITMTMAIRQSGSTAVRTPKLLVDYAGGRNHQLLELSEILPPEVYRKEMIN